MLLNTANKTDGTLVVSYNGQPVIRYDRLLYRIIPSEHAASGAAGAAGRAA